MGNSGTTPADQHGSNSQSNGGTGSGSGGGGRGRRGMSGSEQGNNDAPFSLNLADIGGGEEDIEQNQIIGTLLRHLIRSGQIRVLSQDDSPPDSDSSSEDGSGPCGPELRLEAGEGCHNSAVMNLPVDLSTSITSTSGQWMRVLTQLSDNNTSSNKRTNNLHEHIEAAAKRTRGGSPRTKNTSTSSSAAAASNNACCPSSLPSMSTSHRPVSDRTSVPQTIRSREHGLPVKRSYQVKRSMAAGTFSMATRAALNNCFLPNKRWLVNSSSPSERCSQPVFRNRTKTFCCVFTGDGQKLMTASQDHTIRLHERHDNEYECCRVINAPDVGWSILDVATSPDGRHAAYGTWANSIHQCSLIGEEDQWQSFTIAEPEYRFCIFSLRYSHDGSEILVGANERRLFVYSKHSGSSVLKIDAHDDDVNAVCFADNSSNILYSGSDDGLVKVWDRRTLSERHPQPVGTFAGHVDGVTFIDTKGDARYLISNSKDQSIKLWDIRKCSSAATVEATKTAVAQQGWDYRWQRVPGSVRRVPRSIPGDSSVFSYHGHTVLHTLIRCYFSPSHTTGQRYIYTGCARGACVVYDVLTGQIVTKLGGHKGCVRDVAWHQELNEICTSSWDGQTFCWRYTKEVEDGEPSSVRSVDASHQSSERRPPTSQDPDDSNEPQPKMNRAMRMANRLLNQ